MNERRAKFTGARRAMLTLGGAPVHEASRGPLSSPRWRCLEFSSSVSRLLRAWPTRSRVYDDVELSAVQFSGLPGNDRPLTHTVTSHLARSLVLARWRHSISFEVRPLPSLPLAGGVACSLKLRQVQHSKYRPPKQYSNRRVGYEALPAFAKSIQIEQGFIDDAGGSIHPCLSQLCHSNRLNNHDLVSSTKCRKLHKQLIWRHFVRSRRRRAGRAQCSHRRGHWFESSTAHHAFQWVQGSGQQTGQQIAESHDIEIVCVTHVDCLWGVIDA